ncbi:uncharacterized protein LOC118357956 isoform X12 [Oncorhynchus keta]|uniref:uncharacterized protein LOC118357956 isoform X12 n=1 Tax=Oncorhynchus keta TaxID=8018 RepID=UPI00227B42C6|nr:uncharacterized protein LOC118357956 isoform X12 [Oncorhynchus keta]
METSCFSDIDNESASIVGDSEGEEETNLYLDRLMLADLLDPPYSYHLSTPHTINGCTDGFSPQIAMLTCRRLDGLDQVLLTPEKEPACYANAAEAKIQSPFLSRSSGNPDDEKGMDGVIAQGNDGEDNEGMIEEDPSEGSVSERPSQHVGSGTSTRRLKRAATVAKTQGGGGCDLSQKEIGAEPKRQTRLTDSQTQRSRQTRPMEEIRATRQNDNQAQENKQENRQTRQTDSQKQETSGPTRQTRQTDSQKQETSGPTRQTRQTDSQKQETSGPTRQTRQTDNQKQETSGPTRQTDSQKQETSGPTRQTRQTDSQKQETSGPTRQTRQTDSQKRETSGPTRQTDSQKQETSGPTRQTRQTDSQKQETSGPTRQTDSQKQETSGPTRQTRQTDSQKQETSGPTRQTRQTDSQKQENGGVNHGQSHSRRCITRLNALHRRNRYGETLLHIAAMQGDTQWIRGMLSLGPDINMADNAGWTPLHEAVSHGQYEISKHLIQAGALVNCTGENGTTPLLDAVVQGHLQIAELLLKHGADPLLKNNDGQTAYSNTSEPCLIKLMEKNIPNNKRKALAGRSVERSGAGEPIRPLRSVSEGTVSRNIPGGSQSGRTVTPLNILHRKSCYGETLLHIAAIQGDTQGVRDMLSQGLDVNMPDNAGWTPLHEAVSHGHYEISKHLIQAGALVNCTGENGTTPLLDAVVQGHLQIAELLLKHGADPLLKTNNGQTAYSNTTEPSLIKLLEENIPKNKRKALAAPTKRPADSSQLSPSQSGTGRKLRRLPVQADQTSTDQERYQQRRTITRSETSNTDQQRRTTTRSETSNTDQQRRTTTRSETSNTDQQRRTTTRSETSNTDQQRRTPTRSETSNTDQQRRTTTRSETSNTDQQRRTTTRSETSNTDQQRRTPTRSETSNTDQQRRTTTRSETSNTEQQRDTTTRSETSNTDQQRHTPTRSETCNTDQQRRTPTRSETCNTDQQRRTTTRSETCNTDQQRRTPNRSETCNTDQQRDTTTRSETSNTDQQRDTTTRSETSNTDQQRDTTTRSETSNTDQQRRTTTRSETSNTDQQRRTTTRSETSNTDQQRRPPTRSETCNTEQQRDTTTRSETSNTDQQRDTTTRSETSNTEQQRDTTTRSETSNTDQQRRTTTRSETSNTDQQRDTTTSTKVAGVLGEKEEPHGDGSTCPNRPLPSVQDGTRSTAPAMKRNLEDQAGEEDSRPNHATPRKVIKRITTKRKDIFDLLLQSNPFDLDSILLAAQTGNGQATTGSLHDSVDSVVLRSRSAGFLLETADFKGKEEGKKWNTEKQEITKSSEELTLTKDGNLSQHTDHCQSQREEITLDMNLSQHTDHCQREEITLDRNLSQHTDHCQSQREEITLDRNLSQHTDHCQSQREEITLDRNLSQHSDHCQREEITLDMNLSQHTDHCQREEITLDRNLSQHTDHCQSQREEITLDRNLSQHTDHCQSQREEITLDRNLSQHTDHCQSQREEITLDRNLSQHTDHCQSQREEITLDRNLSQHTDHCQSPREEITLDRNLSQHTDHCQSPREEITLDRNLSQHTDHCQREEITLDRNLSQHSDHCQREEITLDMNLSQHTDHCQREEITLDMNLSQHTDHCQSQREEITLDRNLSQHSDHCQSQREEITLDRNLSQHTDHCQREEITLTQEGHLSQHTDHTDKAGFNLGEYFNFNPATSANSYQHNNTIWAEKTSQNPDQNTCPEALVQLAGMDATRNSISTDKSKVTLTHRPARPEIDPMDKTRSAVEVDLSQMDQDDTCCTLIDNVSLVEHLSLSKAPVPLETTEVVNACVAGTSSPYIDDQCKLDNGLLSKEDLEEQCSVSLLPPHSDATTTTHLDVTRQASIVDEKQTQPVEAPSAMEDDNDEYLGSCNTSSPSLLVAEELHGPVGISECTETNIDTLFMQRASQIPKASSIGSDVGLKANLLKCTGLDLQLIGDRLDSETTAAVTDRDGERCHIDGGQREGGSVTHRVSRDPDASTDKTLSSDNKDNSADSDITVVSELDQAETKNNDLGQVEKEEVAKAHVQLDSEATIGSVQDQVRGVENQTPGTEVETLDTLIDYSEACKMNGNGYTTTVMEDSTSLLPALDDCQAKDGVKEDEPEMNTMQSDTGSAKHHNSCSQHKRKAKSSRARPGKRQAKLLLKPKPNPWASQNTSTSYTTGGADTSSSSVGPMPGTKIPLRNLHKRNSMGESHLHLACKKGDLALVRGLLEAGLNVNQIDHAGWTALHEASAAGSEAVVKELLQAGADVTSRGLEGLTPLHDAAASGHCKVVQLLLQYGANPQDKNALGQTAVDLACHDDIKQLLSTFPGPFVQRSSAPSERPSERCGVSRSGSEGRSRRKPAGPARLCCEGDWERHKARHTGVRDTDRDGERDRQPGDIQPRQKDSTTETLHPSEAITTALEDVERKQEEMSTWKLNHSEDARIAAEDKLTMALSEIQSVLNVVLEKQQAEKDDLTKKYRIASDSFRQGVLRSQLTSLASRQKRLLGILQKQSDLKLQLRTWKGPTLTQHSQTGRDQNISHSSTTTSSPAPSERSLAGNQEGSHASPLFSSTGSHDNRDKQEGSSQTSQVAPPRKHPTQHRDDNNKNNTTFPSQQGNRNSKPQHGNTLDMGSNVLQQWTASDGEENRKLIGLIKKGVITPGEDVLQLMWRGCVHQASLLLEGWIRDSVTGREFQAPELWVAAILGNNIPVSSAYAWDKVTYGDRSLSGYLLGVVDVTAPAAQNPAESTHHDGSSAQPQDVPSAGAPLSESSAVLRNIMQIKSIRLIGDEEFVPHHIMDRYWDSLTQTHTDDWLF